MPIVVLGLNRVVNFFICLGLPPICELILEFACLLAIKLSKALYYGFVFDVLFDSLIACSATFLLCKALFLFSYLSRVRPSPFMALSI